MMQFLKFRKVFAFTVMALLTTTTFTAIAMEDHDRSSKSFGSKKKTVKMNYYLEDPSVLTNLGSLTTTVQSNLVGIPQLKDPEMSIDHSPAPDKNHNFIYKPQTENFDKASVFATVRTAMNMYRGDLGSLSQLYPMDKDLQKVVKYWDKGTYGPLVITTEAGEDANAFYNREGKKRELKFFSFTGDNREVVHTCRSSDIVTHESGHAMLDIMHPEFFDTNSPQTGGYHESFGDQTAIFWTLNDKFLCNKLISDTKGNLHQKENNFLASLAEQFGTALGMPNGLRNADDDVLLKDADQEVHAISTVYTGAMYDVLVSAFDEAALKISDPTQQVVKLYDVGQQFRQMNIQSLVQLKNPAPSFSDFAHSLDMVAKQRSQSKRPTALDALNWSSYINTEFTRRGIPVSNNSTFNAPVNVKKVRLCGTVVHNHEKHDK